MSDIEELRGAVERIVADVRPHVERLMEAFGIVVDHLCEVYRAVVDLFTGVALPELARRFAIECMDVTEVDIRDVQWTDDGTVIVRLWNHRRIPLPDGWLDRFAAQRGLSVP